MLKILPIAFASLAATTLWGQLESVGVTSGQTVRLNVTARPPDPCAAQIGFLDSAGKPLGPSSTASLEPGKSSHLAGAAASDCKPDVLRTDTEKRASGEVEESAIEAEPNQARPAGGNHVGIKVHGHWIVDVRNPDGTLAVHREFENTLNPTGAATLVGSLSRASVTGLWQVALLASIAASPCNEASGVCLIGESAEVYPLDSRNLLVNAPTSGPNSGKIVLTGSVTVVGSGTFSGVATFVDVCAAGGSPTSCTTAASTAMVASLFTDATFLPNNPNVPVVPGQLVQVTVVISFS